MRGFIARGARSACLVGAALVSWGGLAWAHPPGSERNAASLMALEQQWLAALHRRDVTTLARILAREFIDSDYLGHAIPRAQYLAYFAHAARHPAPPLRQQFEACRVRFVAGGEVAIVTGVVVTEPTAGSRATASSASSGSRQSRFTDVFVWREGRWQAVTGQETRFTPAKD
jgi:ketosteroid isomerase-like protein